MKATNTNQEVIMGEVSFYKGCFIMPVEVTSGSSSVVGFDVVDRRTGKWGHYPSRRLARWTASVWTRLNAEFTTNKPIPANTRKDWTVKAAMNELKKLKRGQQAKGKK